MKSITRHIFSMSILIAVFISLITCTTIPQNFSQQEWNNDSFVSINSGIIQGSPDKQHTWSWKGIPFAKPPVGELRWKAPRTVEPWNGIKKAVRFGDKSVQVQSIFTGIITGSEDCLTLNVWRPRTEEINLPVYVWIHGGGNSIGNASMSDYQGQAFAARNNAVFVSLQYRLGPLGWLYHPALENDDPLDSSGNYGLLDLIAGLNWIQENIGQFGGNAGNVTISGESAGACNVLALINSPLASGLFHKAVMQSGYRKSVTREEAAEQAGQLVAYLAGKRGLDPCSLSLKEIKELLNSSRPKDIQRFYKAGATGMINHVYHIQDGTVFPENGYEDFNQGHMNNPVPLLVGTNHDESKMFLFFDPTYSSNDPEYQTAARIGSLNFKNRGADSVAASIRKNPDNPQVFMYRFDWGTPFDDGSSVLPGKRGAQLGAYHTAEVPFFLGTDTSNGALFSSLVYTSKNRESRRLLKEEIQSYIFSFINTGDPNELNPDSINWPVWDDSHTFLTLNADNYKVLIGEEKDFVTRDRIQELVDNISDETTKEFVKKYIY